MRYCVKNCPAYNDFCEQIKTYECKNVENCLLKQLYEKMRDCSCELINLLEIEEVDEQL